MRTHSGIGELQLLEQFFERHEIRLRFKNVAMQLRQEFGNRRITRKLAADTQRAPHGANQVSGFCSVAVGNRVANDEIVLFAVTSQHNLERSEQDDRKRSVFTGGD